MIESLQPADSQIPNSQCFYNNFCVNDQFELSKYNIGHKPTQQQITNYLKKKYAQIHQFNQHIDTVRRNYLKRNSKATVKINLLQTSVDKSFTNTNLLSHNQDIININQLNQSINQNISRNVYSQKSNYLTQLKDKQTNKLPDQIKNNKLLFSLYKKLDGFQMGLIKQHQKQRQRQKLNKSLKKNQNLQMYLTDHQISVHKKFNQHISSLKNKLQIKKFQLSKIRETLTNQLTNQFDIHLNSIIINRKYMQNLASQTQKNLILIEKHILSLQQKYARLKDKKYQQVQLKVQVDKLFLEYRDILCELQNKKLVFM